MSIKWNKVTWYSRLLAIVLFVLTFYIGFLLGQQKQAITPPTIIPAVKAPEKTTPAPLSITMQNIEETNFTGKVAQVSGTSTLAKDAQAYITKEISDFRTEANSEVPPMIAKFGAGSPPATYEIDITAADVKSAATESVVLSTYSFTGGANGSSTYKVITVGIPSGKILSLSDVIKAGEQGAFMTFLEQELNDWRPEGSSDSVVFPDQVKSLTFGSLTNWSLDNTNLTIYFDQYTIGPGSLGEVPFAIPLSKIQTFLNPAY